MQHTTMESTDNFSHTMNGAVAFKTTSDNLLDLFVNGVRGCDTTYVLSCVRKAWNENPLLLMKLICFTRDPRNGKGERDLSFLMLSIIQAQCPKTYAACIRKFAATYGRIDDLLTMYTSGCDNCVENNGIEMQVFADLLTEDLTSEHPSLAVKWAPRETNGDGWMAKILAKKMFPNAPNSSELYRKNVLRPLSAKVTILEQLMCANKWAEINYEHVPSQAMKLYGRKSVKQYVKSNTVHESDDQSNPDTESNNNTDTNTKNTKSFIQREGAFLRHDKERYTEYISNVKGGTAKINTAGLQPHQLVKEVGLAHDDTIQQQWDTMVSKLRNTCNLGNCMAVVDVSGSMGALCDMPVCNEVIPIQVAVSLGLLISELVTDDAYKNKMITFSTTPQIVNIEGDNLHEKITNMCQTSWSMSTNIEKVFDLILDTSIIHKVPQQNMIKTLFIFTDMQFDQASKTTHNTMPESLFTTISNKYKNAGYEMPQLVFWNLSTVNSKVNAFPVKSDSCGCAYLSGFSAALLKTFMAGEKFDATTILIKLLEQYDVTVDDGEAHVKL